MIKKLRILNPVVNRKIAVLFSLLFLANSIYYSYHAIFTPFIPQKINCRVIYLILIAAFLLLSFLKNKNWKGEWKKILKIFVLMLLPSAVLIAVSYFWKPVRFKNSARLFANLIIMASGFIAFLRIFGYDFFSKIKNGLPSKEKYNRTAIIILFFVIILNLSFGTYHLAKFSAVDEPLWTFQRIPKFWNNVMDGEWQKTMISDKPGITTALLSGIGTIWTNPKEYKLVEQEEEIKVAAGEIEKMNFPMRFPILLFNSLMLIVFYCLLSKLFNKHTALLSIIFIGLSPILLGISRIINPDSIFWVFSSLSLISFFLSIKYPENRYLFLSGLFLGLSLLTKYVANILFVFYFGIIFADFFLNGNRDGKNWKAYFKEALKKYFIIVYFSILTFFVFLPAAWVNLGRIAEGTILSEAFSSFWKIFVAFILLSILEVWVLKGKIFGFIFSFFSKNKNIILKIFCFIFLISIVLSAINTFFGMKWSDFEGILASPKSNVLNPKSIIGAFLANFYPLIFGIHPIAFFSVMVILAMIIIKNKKNDWTKENSIWAIYLLMFIFVYYLASLISKVGATVRYQITVYPLIFIAAAFGIDFLFKKLKEKSRIIILGIIASLLIISIENIRPFYFSYASEILPQKYVLNLKDMGDGSYEAAQYLNNLPGAEDLIIWTDKIGVCYFFKGGCFNAFEMYKGMRIDYFVVSAGRQSRTIRHVPYKGRHNDFEISVDKIYELNNYDFRLDIGGRPNNFIKIFSYEKLVPNN